MENANLHLPGHYWTQADRMRAKAATVLDPDIKEIYVALAAQWERLAYSAATPIGGARSESPTGSGHRRI
jgi:hypothetical protein